MNKGKYKFTVKTHAKSHQYKSVSVSTPHAQVNEKKVYQSSPRIDSMDTTANSRTNARVKANGSTPRIQQGQTKLNKESSSIQFQISRVDKSRQTSRNSNVNVKNIHLTQEVDCHETKKLTNPTTRHSQKTQN